MKVKAKKSFMDLHISNNYQGLHCDDYFALRRGETVDLDIVPEIIEKHVTVKKEKDDGD